MELITSNHPLLYQKSQKVRQGDGNQPDSTSCFVFATEDILGVPTNHSHGVHQDDRVHLKKEVNRSTIVLQVTALNFHITKDRVTAASFT